MITIVNRTVFTTPSTSSPQTITIPATTAGNTLVVLGMTPGISAAGAPTLGSYLMGSPVGQWGSGIAFLDNIPGGQTSLIYASGHVVPSAAVVYELSPCTKDDSGELNVTPGTSETGVALTESSNAAYFEVIAQDATSGSYNSVNTPWVLDYTISPLPQTGASMGSVVYILNSTGPFTPTWNVTNGSTHCGVCGIAFLDNSPPSGGAMSSSPYLPLQDIIDVSVQVAAQIAGPPTFNQGLIIGPSGVIPTTGANSRIQKFSSLAGILTAGFTTSDPEYLHAVEYFSQSPTPQYVWIGAQNPSGLNTVVVHSGAAGTNYKVGDVITVVQGGASGGTLQVTTIGGGGTVTGLSLITAGTGYSIATALTTTGGSGTGLEVDISAILEPALLAVQACRTAQSAWYGFTVTDAADSDISAIASWVQAASPAAYYFASTADSAVLNNTGGNIAATLQAAKYGHVLLAYSTTQSGAAPNNAYIASAYMGAAMGLNTGLANSYFTMKFKVLIGITPEPLSQNQVSTIEGLNCNLYLNYGNVYTFAEQGIEPGGNYFFQTINLDMLVAFIQTNVMNVLVALPAVPQTDPGEALLINAVNQAAQQMQVIGFIAGGTWKGVQILNLVPGQSLPNGFIAQAPPYSTQTSAARAARQAMPIYLSIIEAGAVHFLNISVVTQL